MLVEPEPEHQHIPKLSRAIAVPRLMLVPDLSDERRRKIRILALDNVSACILAHSVPEPLRQRDRETHLFAINDVGGEKWLHGFLEDVFAGSASEFQTGRHR